MKLLFIVFTFFFLTGCTPKYFYQVYDVACDNCLPINESYFGGNDSVKVEYQFWGQNGLMKIVIHNQMTRPIYIDWKRSGFYRGTEKLNYFLESEKGVIKDISVYGGYRNIDNQPIVIGSGQSQSITYKEERLSYVVSQSQYTNVPYYYNILINDYFIVDIVPKTIDTLDGKPYNIYTKSFSKPQTLLAFRNYITWTLTENSQENGNIIDNSFYIESVKEMNEVYFGKTNINRDPKKLYKIITKSGYSLEDRENGIYPTY